MKKVALVGMALAVVGVANAVEVGNGFSVGGGVDVGLQTMKNYGQMPNVGSWNYKNSAEPVWKLYGYVEKSNVIVKASLLYSKGSDNLITTNGLNYGADIKHTAIEGQIGYRIVAGQFNAIPYVAIGWENYELTDTYGYDIEQKATYGKLGAVLGYNINQKIGLYSDLYFGKALSTDLSTNYQTTREILKRNRYGIEVGATYKLSPNLQTKLGVFYNYADMSYNDGTSNKFKQYGVLIGLGF